ncbi:MAG: inositol monophosphatase [Candidatus Levybacteria bacterium]|nr:inositol monophosphatase [Candidatus Levybacteria bacterium]
MDNLQQEKEFFKKVSKLIFNLLSSDEQKTLTVKYKQRGVADIATSSDIAIENFLTQEILNLFPKDKILGEENSSDLIIDPRVRTWIIDPICGTFNYARGIKNSCTNLALAYQGNIIAACVLDHARCEFIWSIVNKKVYVNDSLTKGTKHSIPLIDIDLGGSYFVRNKQLKRKYANFLYRILTETNFVPTSYNTSLGFAYTAIGRLDGYIVLIPHIWDVAAANFLIEQNGGIVSDLAGKPWTFNSTGVIAANNKTIHAKLVELYLNS